MTVDVIALAALPAAGSDLRDTAGPAGPHAGGVRGGRR
jgi:hypothetical protein